MNFAAFTIERSRMEKKRKMKKKNVFLTYSKQFFNVSNCEKLQYNFGFHLVKKITKRWNFSVFGCSVLGSCDFPNGLFPLKIRRVYIKVSPSLILDV